MPVLVWNSLFLPMALAGTDVMVQVDEKTAEQEKDKQKRWLGYGG